jgi:hypothetical protein
MQSNINFKMSKTQIVDRKIFFFQTKNSVDELRDRLDTTRRKIEGTRRSIWKSHSEIDLRGGKYERAIKGHRERIRSSNVYFW